MSYKHNQIAERLLQEAGIIYQIPTAGHYVIYKYPDTFNETKLIWFPKSNKVQTWNITGSIDIDHKGTREDTIEYIKNWLKEGI